MILIIDDDRDIRSSLTMILQRNEYDVLSAEGPSSAMDIVRSREDIELVLMDMNYSLATDGEEGLTLLRQFKVFRPEVPVILMTAWGSIDLAVRGMRIGAFDFITKPWNNGTLLERVETAIAIGKKHTTPRSFSANKLQKEDMQKENALPYIIGKSQELQNVLSTISKIAQTNAPVLIMGESGTGKELIAQAVHNQSKRNGKAFVKVNLGGISSSLFESEMFGHKAGSFTDAKTDRIGRFEMAEGGTIFLDEIGELELASQVKLLRVLQDQTYEVLGDSRTRRADVRIVCATNANLQQMVQDKTFREDLFYRINLITVHLPALRERKEDIPLLVNHFIQSTCSANAIQEPKVSKDAIRYLQSLPYPGNIRELKNLVERTLLMSMKEKLTEEDFRMASSALPQSSANNQTDFTTQLNGKTLEHMERAMIEATINKHKGNLSLVAKELGISRGALYRKIEKHGL